MPQQYSRPSQTCDQCHFITHVDGLDCYLCSAGSGHFIAYNGNEPVQSRGGVLSSSNMQKRAHEVSFHQKQALAQAVLHDPELGGRIKDKLHRDNLLTLDLDP